MAQDLTVTSGTRGRIDVWGLAGVQPPFKQVSLLVHERVPRGVRVCSSCCDDGTSSAASAPTAGR